MEGKRCEKCGETVEATRAFCPGCGAAMEAEEQRGDVSAFDASAGTVQFGKTVYGKMLSQMGLNISDAPKKISVAPEAAAVNVPPAEPPAGGPQVIPARSSKIKWIILAAALLFLGMLAVIAAAALIFIYSRYQQSTF